MKKLICVLLALVICLSMAVTAFAADGFVSSPGECDHDKTSLKNQKDATCTEDGYTGDHVCDKCGTVVEEGEPIPATGHKFDKNGVCEICGATDVPKTGDNAQIFLWVTLMVVSAAALVTVTSIRRKRA